MLSFICKILILIYTFICAKTYDPIKYDWSGQFGIVNQNASILWNKDWKSKRLLFDGTWTNYPKMFGPEIENGFLNFLDSLDLSDSTKIESYFHYEQGDYLLDKFSVGLINRTKNRFSSIHGFKRSFLGNENQYNSGFTQPLQQSYVASYESKHGKDNGGIVLGHFNTLSGFPDLFDIAIFDNRITTSHLFWNRLFGKSKILFEVDYFLQKYLNKHNWSEFHSTRFLTRNRYYGNFTYGLKHNRFVFVEFSKNIRNIKIDSLHSYEWRKTDLGFSVNNLKFFVGVFNNANKNLVDLGFKTEIKNRPFHAKLNYELNNYLTHPFYHLIERGQESVNTTYGQEKVEGSIYIKVDDNKIMTTLIYLDSDEDYWNSILSDSVDYEVDNIVSDIVLDIPVRKYFGLELKYKSLNQKSIFSGGFGRRIAMNIKKQSNLFNGFMKLDIDLGITHFGKRSRVYFLNPIEMVPNKFYEKDNSSPQDITFVNTKIVANVSSFTIGFEWYNIHQIIFGYLQNGDSNPIDIYPGIPGTGKQISLIIEWRFDD